MIVAVISLGYNHLEVRGVEAVRPDVRNANAANGDPASWST